MSDLPDAPEFGGDVMLPTIDAALRRLSDALGALETVAERRQENDQGQDSLAELHSGSRRGSVRASRMSSTGRWRDRARSKWRIAISPNASTLRSTRSATC